MRMGAPLKFAGKRGSDRRTLLMTIDPESLIRPLLRELQSYVPGEQPKVKGLVKLNTNENPYPPGPKVLRAIRTAADQRLRLYPNPTAERLREKLAKFHRCGPENIIVGNGSDELLALVVRAFVEPAQKNDGKVQQGRSTVQFFEPSYSLYPVLAEIHGARKNAVPLSETFDLPGVAKLAASEATARSQLATSWQPAAVAMPCTEATTGFGKCTIACIMALQAFMICAK